MDLQPTERSWGFEDRSWLRTQFGTDQCAPITLNLALFTEAIHYPDGYIPSGTFVGKVTATGLYGPYDDDALDGRAVAAGVLFNGVYVRPGNESGKAAAALYRTGWIRVSRLPANSGHDAAAEADLAAHMFFEA